MELTLEHVERQPPERLNLRAEDQTSVFEVEYRLEESALGTRFTHVSELEWKRLPRLLHGTFARDVRTQLRALKRHLEK